MAHFVNAAPCTCSHVQAESSLGPLLSTIPWCEYLKTILYGDYASVHLFTLKK